MKLTRKMPSFEGVAVGATATCRLPLGLTYNQLMIAYSGTTFTPANMSEIRLIANGKPVQRWAGADLDSINQFDGRNAASGQKVLFLDMERFGLRTKLGQELTAIPTGAKNNPVPISTLQLEVDIDGSAVAPSLDLVAVQTAPRDLGGKLQPVKQVRKFQYTPAGTGIFEISDLPKLGGAEINRVSFKGATIDKVTLELDGFTAFERTTAENVAAQADGGRVPQPGFWIVDTTEDGNGGETIKTAGVQDLRFKLDVSTAATITVYVEYLEPIRN